MCGCSLNDTERKDSGGGRLIEVDGLSLGARSTEEKRKGGLSLTALGWVQYSRLVLGKGAHSVLVYSTVRSN